MCFSKVNKILIGLGILAVIGVILISGCVEEQGNEGIELKVFHAGSLAKPFAELEKDFEERHKNIDVQREASGSMIAIKKVTQLHKNADIIALADASLIKMMYPDYSNFTIKFATNSIVIAYTNKSKYHNEINKDNWYKILRKDDVKFGFSNPNDDPCGYRSMIAIQLAEFKYNDSKIFDDLIEKNTNIKAKCNLSICTIVVPNSTEINPNTNKVMVRDKSMELISGLQSKEIDYAFMYKSIGFQHKFNFIELPSQINLGDNSKDEIYKKVRVRLEDGRIQEGKVIVYGLTIPKNSKHKKEAIEFVKFIISEDGKKILKDLRQTPLNPAIVDNISNVPDELKNFVKEK